MSADDPFLLLIQRVRAGDQDAATELVRQYEPAIRRAVRFQLRDSRLRRALDSMDVCQSVMGSFFARAALGQFEIDKPEQVLRLLVTMARNKLATQARKPHIRRQETGGLEPGEAAKVAEPVSPDITPSRQAAGRDLLEAFRNRLSDDERELADQRAAGREWGEIAAARGESAEALRKRLARALDRVSQQLGLDQADAD
jgi:RNA polymerase sigma-70 factor (ECF subfamily)